LSKHSLKHSLRASAPGPWPLVTMGGPFNFIPRSSSLSRSQLPRELHSSGVEQVKLEHVEHYEKPDSYAALPPSGPRPAAKSTHATFEPSKAFVRQLTTKSEYRCSPWATLRAAWCLAGGAGTCWRSS